MTDEVIPAEKAAEIDVETVRENFLASYPENYGNKAIEFVINCHPSDLVLDYGTHCVCCGRGEDEVQLISNPEIPRVICINCYTWAVMELQKRACDDLQNSGDFE